MEHIGDLEKLLKTKGHMPEDRFLLVSRRPVRTHHPHKSRRISAVGQRHALRPGIAASAGFRSDSLGRSFDMSKSKRARATTTRSASKVRSKAAGRKIRKLRESDRCSRPMEELDNARDVALWRELEERPMRQQLVILAVAGLLVSSGVAFAQTQTPKQYDDSPGAPTASQSTTPDRPPAATMPDTNVPSPEKTGQAPAASEKMEPGMDSVGGPKSPPGEEKK
jgi:hypothetical protein